MLAQCCGQWVARVTSVRSLLVVFAGSAPFRASNLGLGRPERPDASNDETSLNHVRAVADGHEVWNDCRKAYAIVGI